MRYNVRQAFGGRHMEKKKTKKKMRRKTQRLLISILVGLLLVVFLFAGYKLYTIAHEYRVAQRSYNKLSDSCVSDGDPSALPALPGGDGSENSPDLADPSPISVDFDALLAQNTDVKGWLYSEGTVINYPVMQSLDNDFYLHRLYDKSYNASGSLFIDYLCPGDFSGDIAIIYGHHMNDGSMFASLGNYRNQEYYEEHPVMYLNTPNGNYRVDLFSGFITAADSTVYTVRFANDEAYQAYLLKMKAFSDFECDVTPTVDDHIIVLSTCTYEYNDARYVVFGKLTPTR